MRNSIINSIAILIVSLSLLGVAICNTIASYKIHTTLGIMATVQANTAKLAISNRRLIENKEVKNNAHS